jgi:hypothetical protein
MEAGAPEGTNFELLAGYTGWLERLERLPGKENANSVA